MDLARRWVSRCIGNNERSGKEILGASVAETEDSVKEVASKSIQVATICFNILTCWQARIVRLKITRILAELSHRRTKTEPKPRLTLDADERSQELGGNAVQAEQLRRCFYKIIWVKKRDIN